MFGFSRTERVKVMTLEEFARIVLENTCGRSVRDSRDRDKIVYNATDVPKEFQEVRYIYDLHCNEVEVWVRHTVEGPVIIEYNLKDY